MADNIHSEFANNYHSFKAYKECVRDRHSRPGVDVDTHYGMEEVVLTHTQALSLAYKALTMKYPA